MRVRCSSLVYTRRGRQGRFGGQAMQEELFGHEIFIGRQCKSSEMTHNKGHCSHGIYSTRFTTSRDFVIFSPCVVKAASTT